MLAVPAPVFLTFNTVLPESTRSIDVVPDAVRDSVLAPRTIVPEPELSVRLRVPPTELIVTAASFAAGPVTWMMLVALAVWTLKMSAVGDPVLVCLTVRPVMLMVGCSTFAPVQVWPCASWPNAAESRPSSRSLLNAWAAAPKRIRGVISESLPTLTPKYSALALKSTLPGSVVLLPSITWNKPLDTLTDP